MNMRKKARPAHAASAARRPAGTGEGDLRHAPGIGATAETSAPAPRWLTIVAAGVVVLAAVAAYYNSFAGPFINDDVMSVVENRTIRRLWPIWPVLSPPCSGETVGGRPLLNLSLAINYAIGGLQVCGYHVTNVLIHIAAALLLLGILRRTFRLPTLRDRFGTAAVPLALAGTLLWTVHPLQTESVTYVSERAESLVGLLYLLTLYCVIRGAAAAPGSARLGTVPFFAAQEPVLPSIKLGEKGDCPLCALLWYSAAVLACLLGMACKEVMVTAPLIVLLYDRTFLAGSFGEAWRRRRGLYVGLAATWGLLIYLVFSTGLIARQPEMGAPDAWGYARSQPAVILHYLRLAVWPNPLCLDYAWPVANTLGEILPGAIVLGLLFAATLWGLIARRAWGFLGAWFLLILAPTSSILPLGNLAYEHRMYLPLAAVVVFVVVGGYAFWNRLLAPGPSPLAPRPSSGTVPGLDTMLRWAPPVLVWAAALLALGCATVARNRDYRSTLAIYQDAVDKRPNSPAAHINLGNLLNTSGRTDEAMEHYKAALQFSPDSAKAHNNLGLVLAGLGRTDEAIEHFREAVRLHPDYHEAHNNLGNALVLAGRAEEAIAHYNQALQLKPSYALAHFNLANLLARNGRIDEAIEHYSQALRLAESTGQTSLTQPSRAQLELYRAGRPNREVPGLPGKTAP
jgi:Flp pilus assembly protein TadD